MTTILIVYGVMILLNVVLFAWICWKDYSSEKRKEHARKTD